LCDTFKGLRYFYHFRGCISMKSYIKISTGISIKFKLFAILIGNMLFCISCKPLTNDDNNTLAWKEETGRYLFFDKRLSITKTKSCASCHDPAMAFTDGYRKPLGVFADLHFRNTPTLINMSGQKYFNWANPEILSIEEQMDGPLFGSHPIEMGLDSTDTHTLKYLEKDTYYTSLFKKAYPDDANPVSWKNIKQSLAAYIKTFQSYNAPYDHYILKDTSAISESAKAGEMLFFSPKYNCGQCHRPPSFGADSTMQLTEQYANIGLYDYEIIAEKGGDLGLFHSTGDKNDRGKFKIPTLRNLSLTGPYFHDGSAATLQDVLNVYQEGGRIITYGDFQGNGKRDSRKHPLISGIEMTEKEKLQLLDFLYSLNDFGITTNPKYQSPFKNNGQRYVQ
jgi:cytochrome c peroxidase